MKRGLIFHGVRSTGQVYLINLVTRESILLHEGVDWGVYTEGTFELARKILNAVGINATAYHDMDMIVKDFAYEVLARNFHVDRDMLLTSGDVDRWMQERHGGYITYVELSRQPCPNGCHITRGLNNRKPVILRRLTIWGKGNKTETIGYICPACGTTLIYEDRLLDDAGLKRSIEPSMHIIKRMFYRVKTLSSPWHRETL